MEQNSGDEGEGQERKGKLVGMEWGQEGKSIKHKIKLDCPE
jgi:hypothetical protein